MRPDQIARIFHAANNELRWEIGEDPIENRGFIRLESAVQLEAVHPAGSDEAAHDRWLMHASSGHPNAVPFEDLPEEQRQKDRLFRAIVAALKDR